FHIYTPLSYGDTKYAKDVATRGEKIFGKNYTGMFDFLSYNDYLSFLAGMDIIIFNHFRQQGMGNCIQALGLGKKVYLNQKSKQFKFLKEKGLTVFSIDELDTTKIENKLRIKNQEIVVNYFSRYNLIKQLKM